MNDTLPRIDISGELPHLLDSSIVALLRTQCPNTLNNAKIQSLKEQIAARKPPRYSSDWAAFTYLYFSANFLKTYLAILSASSGVTGKRLKILDLGSGGGASTAACVSAFSYLGNEVIEIVAIDKSAEQLHVFKEVALPWIEGLVGHSKTKIVQDDVLTYLSTTAEEFDFVILSYVTPEINQEDEKLLRKHLIKKLNDSRTNSIIIDSDIYHRGITVEMIGEAPYLLPYSQVLFRAPSVEKMGFNVPPKFSNNLIEYNIILQYFKSWENQDFELLRKILDPDCKYVINNKRTLCGIDEIQAYWLHNANRQRNIQFTFEFLNRTPSNATFQWYAEFDRIDTNDHRILNGQMYTTFRNGTISFLSEAYSQQVSPSPRDSPIENQR